MQESFNIPETKRTSTDSRIFGKGLMKEPRSWDELQNKVALLFNQAGYDAKIEHVIETVRGHKQIDVYVDLHEPLIGAIICECKYWEKRVPQNEVHAFRTVVHDSGASEGILISKCGFQSGAKEAAALSNVRLCTWIEFLNLISNAWIAGRVEECLKQHTLLQKYLDPYDMPVHLLNDCGRARYQELLKHHVPTLAIFNCLAMNVARLSPSPYTVKRDNYITAFADLVDNSALLESGNVDGIFECLLELAANIKLDIESLFDGLDLDDCPYNEVCSFARTAIDSMRDEIKSDTNEYDDPAWTPRKSRMDTVMRIMWELLDESN